LAMLGSKTVEGQGRKTVQQTESPRLMARAARQA
jgi:hypothetical protein